MKKRRSAEAIIGILREVEAAGQAAEVCRKHGISEQTYYRWKKKYGGLDVTEAKRIKDLERENQRLRKLVADYALAQEALSAALKKRGWA